MKARAALLSLALATASPVSAYVIYDFSGYSDEEDIRFPEFTFYTEDFLKPTGNATLYFPDIFRIYPTSWSYSQNVSSLSAFFLSQNRSGFYLVQRYAIPGREKMTLNFNILALQKEGIYGNGVGLLTVTEIAGSIPDFVRRESDPGPLPGLTDIPIADLPPQPGAGSVPEPAIWLSMIAGFGLIGSSLRRRHAQEAV